MPSARTKQDPAAAHETSAQKGTSRIRDRLPLPDVVARALNAAAPTAGKKSAWGSRALALVPLVVTLAFGALVMPRAVPPSEVPLPVIDTRLLERAEATDHDLAELARRGLSDDTRVLGSAIRTYFRLHDDEHATPADVATRREELARGLSAVLRSAPHEVAMLRAVQLESFQTALRDYEATGVESDELRDVAGGFVRRMKDVGWMEGRTVLADRHVRGVFYKLAWNTTVGVADNPAFAPSLDELRALHAFYIRHPQVGALRKATFDEARKIATTKAACDEVDAHETAALEDFRLEKIKRLGALDPDYPTEFAIGVVSYRRGKYAASAESFRDWLRAHPDGPLALRARNHLRAALAADQAL